MRFDVLSPALDSSAFGAHNALLAVLEELKEQGKLDGITGLNVWSDNGGHFTSGLRHPRKPSLRTPRGPRASECERPRRP